jgi:hypothetical protein
MTSKGALSACIASAIEGCRESWRERWNREPTLNELVHPFEIILSAQPERYVRDPSSIERPRPPVVIDDPSRFEARLLARDARGFDRWTIGEGLLRCETSLSEDHLRVEYERREPITDADALRVVVLAIALPAMKHYRRRINRMTVVPADSLGDPVRIGPTP